MKQSKKSRNSSVTRAGHRANRRIALCFLSLALAVLALILLCVNIHHNISVRDGDPAPRYELETSSEINFNVPDIMVHTAEDGVAVVGTARPVQSARTDNPDTIWQNDTSHTHGGFTLPVAMPDGENIGILTIPDIGLSVRVYEGEDYMELMDRGVAHFRSTSSWYGNIGLSAHNINLDGTPGYFLHLYRLRPGAIIRYETALGVREYAVQTITEISQYDWSWLDRSEDNRLTLITCITGRADLRLVVSALER